jgi:diguanylate cyclase (GGDEF)-like protein/PAS domain S-box-containing protein
MRWLLQRPWKSDDVTVARAPPLFERPGERTVGHVCAVAVGLVQVVRVGGDGSAIALASFVCLLTAHLAILITAGQKPSNYSKPLYHAVSFLWAGVGGIWAATNLVITHDPLTHWLSLTLAYGLSGGIAARSLGAVRIAIPLICLWLLPMAVAAPFCGAAYLALSAYTVLFCGAICALVHRNGRDFNAHTHAMQALNEREADFHAMFTNLAVGINETDPATGRFHRVNPEYCRIVGRSEAELLGSLTVADITHPEDQARLRLTPDMLKKIDKAEEAEKRYRRPDGREVWIRICGALVEQGSATRRGRFATVTHDITKHQAADAALRQSEAMLRLSMQAGRIGCFQHDLIARTIHADAESRAIYGWGSDEQTVPASWWFATLPAEDAERVRQETEANRVLRLIEQNYAYRILRASDGQLRDVEIRLRVDYNAEEAAIRSYGVIIDVTERRQAEARIAHLAHHDPLTNLPNRALFRTKLDAALEGAQKGRSFALCYIDLDRFKEVNDTLGHPVGDMLLQAVTARLQSELRETDSAARFGGDEFAVIVAPCEAPDIALRLAKRLITRLAAPFDLDVHHIMIGASIGVAFGAVDGSDAEQLLKNADTALYRAKSQGGGRVCRFEQEMDAQRVARRSLASDIRHALDAGQLVLFYQPIVEIKTRCVVALGALIRWQHPARGLISPDEFIPLAEDNGLILPIGDYVLRTACLQAARWPSAQKVSVNVSAVSFVSPTMVESVAEALRCSGLHPGRLILELTETVMLNDAETALQTLHRLHELGVKIALDDFGTGFSSLSYLQRFPFDKVKIDRSFVANLGVSPQTTTIIRAVVDLCNALGMITIAEGVETEAQYQALLEQGCLHAQGYLISRPVPSEILPGLLSSQHWQPQDARSEAA